MSKKTVIIGATPNSSRYAYLAAEKLSLKGHEIVPVGIKKGAILNQPILDLKSKPNIQDVDTVTLYINPIHQKEWENYILDLHPKRIVFNPGTENPDLEQKAEAQGIEAINACTLVMLSANTY